MTPQDLLALGFHIFPVDGKMPLVRWTLESSSDREQILRWQKRHPTCGWGVDTGKSGLFVLDDDRGKHPQAQRSLDALEFDNGSLPATFTVRTKSGGYHYYYKGAGKNSSGNKLGPGLDTRGQGGFVVAPGSPGYDVVLDFPIAPVPDWLIDIVGRPTERKKSEVDIEYDRRSAIDMAIEYLLSADPAIEGDGGDAHTYRVACRVRDYGVSEDVALDLLLENWNDVCSPPWDADELQAKVRNAYQYAAGDPGNANPELVFEPFVDERPTKKKSLFIDANELVNQTLTINYLVHDLIETPATGMMFGESGAGKSFLALGMALGVASGTDWLGNFAARGSVFYLAGEGQKGIPRRLKAHLKHFNLQLDDQSLFVSRSRIELNSTSAQRMVAEIKAMALAAGPPALIIVDTLARHIPESADENSAKDVGAFINAIDYLKDTFNCVVLIIHHSGKQAKDSSRGSSALKAALDFEIQVTQDSMRFTKQKDGELPQPAGYQLHDVELENGISSAVALPASIPNGVKHLTGDAAVALDVLRMEVSQCGTNGVPRSGWKKAFAEQFSGDIAKRTVAKKFERAEALLLKNATIAIENGLVVLSLIDSDSYDDLAK